MRDGVVALLARQNCAEETIKTNKENTLLAVNARVKRERERVCGTTSKCTCAGILLVGLADRIGQRTKSMGGEAEGNEDREERVVQQRRSAPGIAIGAPVRAPPTASGPGSPKRAHQAAAAAAAAAHTRMKKKHHTKRRWWPITAKAALAALLLLFGLLLLLLFLSVAQAALARLRPYKNDEKHPNLHVGVLHAPLRQTAPMPNESPRIPRIALLLHVRGKAAVHPSWRACAEHSGSAEWTRRVYGLEDTDAFVYSDFIEFSETYAALRRHRPALALVFAKYMLALKHGGIVADARVVCRKPLESWLAPNDTLVTVWNSQPLKHRRRSALRKGISKHPPSSDSVMRTSVFAATARNAVVRAMCDRINRVSKSGDWFDEENLWTESVLEQAGTPGSSVRILPSSAVSMRPSDRTLVQPKQTPTQLERALEGLASIASSPWLRPLSLLILRAKEHLEKDIPARSEAPLTLSAARSDDRAGGNMQKYPRFTLFLPLTTGNRHEAGALMLWGSYQAGVGAASGPTSMQWLFSLLEARSSTSEQQVFLDVGSGSGYFALAVATRGHEALAIDHSPEAVSRIKRSVEINKLEDRVTVLLGNVGGTSKPLHEVIGDMPHKQVNAVRIAEADGSECEKLSATLPLLRSTLPRLLVLEVAPLLCSSSDGFEALLRQLMEELWYGELYHSGPACERRLRGISVSSKDRTQLSDVEWCTLQRGEERELARNSPSAAGASVETVLAIRPQRTAESILDTECANSDNDGKESECDGNSGSGG